MTFDAARFEQAQLQPRTTVLPVPDLAAFFAPGSNPEWKVRGLSAVEQHLATEACKRRTVIGNIFSAVGDSAEQIKAMREAIGLPSDAVPGEIVYRQEVLVTGSVSPKVDLAVVVKLSEHFPVEFFKLSSEVILLTGRGSIDVGKPEAASTPTTASSSQ
jgi:hypothetical protein